MQWHQIDECSAYSWPATPAAGQPTQGEVGVAIVLTGPALEAWN